MVSMGTPSLVPKDDKFVIFLDNQGRSRLWEWKSIMLGPCLTMPSGHIDIQKGLATICWLWLTEENSKIIRNLVHIICKE